VGKTAILAIRIIGDATEAVTSLERVEGKAGGMEKTMDKASAASVAALAGLAAAGVAAGNAASEAEQAAGAVGSVFGSAADQITALADKADAAVGLSASSYNQLASVLGASLKNMGIDIDETADKTEWMIGLGADLSATFGGTTADAVAALSSLLRGERDPIERYGVSIKEADVAAEAAALGLEDLYKSGDKNASLQATLSLLTKQTADATGQFGREADTAAGQQQRAQAGWDNAVATLGEHLLPLMSQGALILADLAAWVGENSEVVMIFAGGIGILAAGILVINGAMKAFAAVQAIQTAAQWASNAAWLASPITWIVLAIVAAIALIIAGVVLLVQNWELIRTTTERVWKSVVNWLEKAWKWFKKLAVDLTPGWIKDLLGMGNRTVSARMVVEEPAMPQMMTARMAFTADEAAAGFAQPTVTASTTTAGLAASDAGGPASRAAGAGGVTNVTVNFNGLVTDPEATAREIRKVLEDSDKANGRRPAAVVGG
jgi:hypothetical protein